MGADPRNVPPSIPDATGDSGEDYPFAPEESPVGPWKPEEEEDE